jgi:hypothetical protein
MSLPKFQAQRSPYFRYTDRIQTMKIRDVISWIVVVFIAPFLVAIANNLATGQPLTGLTKLSGLSQTFIKSSVPVWAFTLVLLVALVGIYYAVTHRPKRKVKGKVHFVPDYPNCRWSRRTNGLMDVLVAGTFTYEGSGSIIILKAVLRGTDTKENLSVNMEVTGVYPPARHNDSRVWLGSEAKHAIMHLGGLTPVIGIPGKPLNREVILEDKLRRKFLIGPVEFSFSGQP